MDPVREQLIMFVFELLNAARSPEEVRALFDVISPKRQSNEAFSSSIPLCTGSLSALIDKTSQKMLSKAPHWLGPP